MPLVVARERKVKQVRLSARCPRAHRLEVLVYSRAQINVVTRRSSSRASPCRLNESMMANGWIVCCG